jgi:hypothetical protein
VIICVPHRLREQPVLAANLAAGRYCEHALFALSPPPSRLRRSPSSRSDAVICGFILCSPHGPRHPAGSSPSRLRPCMHGRWLHRGFPHAMFAPHLRRRPALPLPHRQSYWCTACNTSVRRYAHGHTAHATYSPPDMSHARHTNARTHRAVTTTTGNTAGAEGFMPLTVASGQRRRRSSAGNQAPRARQSRARSAIVYGRSRTHSASRPSASLERENVTSRASQARGLDTQESLLLPVSARGDR